MCASETLDIYGLVPDSIVDGPGLRYSVFVQGCSHSCPGCHNPESQPFGCGQKIAVSDILSDIRSNRLCKGVTISGGEPFDQAPACAALAKTLKSEGYDVWVYTGYLLEDLQRRSDAGIDELMEAADVIVDGPFLESERSLELDWRGSSNQRLIDIPTTLKTGHIVEWKQPSFDIEPPPSW